MQLAHPVGLKPYLYRHLRFAAFMKMLAKRIAEELKSANHCAVYEPDLTRVWPDETNRRAQITSFAKRHRWRLRHYSHGFCAIFDKEPFGSSPGNL